MWDRLTVCIWELHCVYETYSWIWDVHYEYETYIVYMSDNFSVWAVVQSFAVYFQDFIRHLQVCLVSGGPWQYYQLTFLPSLSSSLSKKMYILTVQLDALVVGLHENDDISSKIDHFGFPLPVLLHCIPCQLDILKNLLLRRFTVLEKFHFWCKILILLYIFLSERRCEIVFISIYLQCLHLCLNISINNPLLDYH